MQLHLLLAQFQAANPVLPSICPKLGCNGTKFRLHQQVNKPLRDAVYQNVIVYRYQCLHCGRTFRVYPEGVTHAHTSQQVQELGILLYFLGLSFGAVSTALDIFGIYLSKSRVYDAVKTAQRLKPDLTRCFVFEAIQQPYQQRGVVHVRCMEQWLPLTLITNNGSGLILTVTTLPKTNIVILRNRINPIITGMNGQLMIAEAYGSNDEGN